MATVTIGGASVTDLLDVSHSGEGASELGTAVVEVPNTQANRGAYAYGDEVRISRGGTVEWTGFVSGKPSRNGGLALTVTARDKRAALHNSEVHRPFYDMDAGEIVREAVQYRVDPRSPKLVFDGSALGDASASTPVFELANLPSVDLAEYGSDLWFLLWEEGASGTDTVTYDAVPSKAAPAGRLLWVETRFLVNNAGGHVSGELELRDHGGNSYVWDLAIPQGAQVVTRRFPVEEASADGLLSGDGDLAFRFEIAGSLPERRAAVIDYVRTRPFGLTPRETVLDVAAVEDADRRVTRRFDTSVLELIDQLATEDAAVSYVSDDRLHYRPTGSVSAPVSVSYTSTRVTDATVSRDATGIVNQVTVQGADGLQKTLRSSASIEYYGVSEREKPLIDTSIQSEADLLAWGEGYLNTHAWRDTDFAFTVADPSFRAVEVGQSMFVEWPPEGLSGLWTVSKVETNAAGFVTVSLTGSGA